MLMHADNRRVDHLDSGIVGSGKRVYDAAPDTGSPPPNEAVAASGARTKRLGQITGGSPGSQDPETTLRTRRSVTPGMPRGLFGSIGLSPFIVREFVPHDSSPGSGVGPAESNVLGPVLVRRSGAGADINPPTTLSETGENDPLQTFGHGTM
ncbi:hypothetical protein ES707_08605 [subsurface metagenome]